MRHQVFGADRLGALQFATKRRDRLLTNHRIDRRQVDQVVHVDRQRPQIQPLSRPAKCRDRRPSSGMDARHIRGLAEKIWKVLAPSSAAFSAAFSSEPAMEVWMPIRRDFMLADPAHDRENLPPAGAPPILQ